MLSNAYLPLVSLSYLGTTSAVNVSMISFISVLLLSSFTPTKKFLICSNSVKFHKYLYVSKTRWWKPWKTRNTCISHRHLFHTWATLTYMYETSACGIGTCSWYYMYIVTLWSLCNSPKTLVDRCARNIIIFGVEVRIDHPQLAKMAINVHVYTLNFSSQGAITFCFISGRTEKDCLPDSKYMYT